MLSTKDLDTWNKSNWIHEWYKKTDMGLVSEMLRVFKMTHQEFKKHCQSSAIIIDDPDCIKIELKFMGDEDAQYIDISPEKSHVEKFVISSHSSYQSKNTSVIDNCESE